MKKTGIALLSFLLLLTAAAADKKLGSEDFIARVRQPSGQQNYAKLSGTISHLRRGGETVEAPIYLGILLSGERRMSQVIVDEHESYRIGQSYTSSGEGTTVTPFKEGGYPDSILANFGVKPEDLSMSFLYWTLEKELAPETFRTAACRVFLLKNPQTGEIAKIQVAADYFFPVKVEFFSDSDQLQEPVRSLEIEKFKETDNGFWVPTRIKLQGPGWRTKVEFDRAEAAPLDPAAPPAGIFRAPLR